MNFLEKIIKKRKENDDKIIVKVSNQDYVLKILSEQTLRHEDIEWGTEQTLAEFTTFTKPYINYSPNDFLMQLDEQTFEELTENRRIEFSQVESFGWYYKKVHRNEIKLFNSTHPNKLNNLKEKNPNIRASSFDQFRDSYRPIMTTNILIGAIGLAYHCFKEEYDDFLRKIKWEDDAWLIKNGELTTFDRQILIQLLLFQSNRETELINTITNDSRTLLLYDRILKDALDFFVYREYSMKDFLQYMSTQNTAPETEPLVEELKLLNDRYVAKGLSYNPKISHVKYIKEFIDLAKTDTSQLKHLVEGKKLNKTAVFLLGMLNLGDRLDEQFAFDNFVPSIIALTVEHIIEMRVKNGDIYIGFSTLEMEKNRNKKFNYVRQYCYELQLIKDLKDQILKMQKTRDRLEKQIDDSVVISDETPERVKPARKEPGERTEMPESSEKDDPNSKSGKMDNLFDE